MTAPGGPEPASQALGELLDLHRRTEGSEAGRTEAIRRFGFAVPSPDALAAIERAAPVGVVELGAGTGYWARLLADRGVDILAYDIDAAPSPTNPWFADSPVWFPVQAGDEGVLDHHGDRCLLLVWPTRNETWAAAAIERYHQAGGEVVAYVGERPGGRTGDDLFHALIGQTDRCNRCAYGVDVACVCQATALFTTIERVAIPTWRGFDDELVILRRANPNTPAHPHRWLRSIRTAMRSR